MTGPFFPEDPPLLDRIIPIVSPHAAGCQDSDCTWCTNAEVCARQILMILAEVPADLLHTALADADAGGRGWFRPAANEPGS